MNSIIREIKQNLIRFFVEEEHGLDVITSLRILLGYNGLEVACNGNSEINSMYGEKHPYLITSTKDESEMVIFLFRTSLHEDCGLISIYFVRRERIFEFNTEEGKSMVSIKQFKGSVGSDMILAYTQFKNGGLPKSLVQSKNSIGSEIVKFKRSFV